MNLKFRGKNQKISRHLHFFISHCTQDHYFDLKSTGRTICIPAPVHLPPKIHKTVLYIHPLGPDTSNFTNAQKLCIGKSQAQKFFFISFSCKTWPRAMDGTDDRLLGDGNLRRGERRYSSKSISSFLVLSPLATMMLYIPCPIMEFILNQPNVPMTDLH